MPTRLTVNFVSSIPAKVGSLWDLVLPQLSAIRPALSTGTAHGSLTERRSNQKTCGFAYSTGAPSLWNTNQLVGHRLPRVAPAA